MYQGKLGCYGNRLLIGNKTSIAFLVPCTVQTSEKDIKLGQASSISSCCALSVDTKIKLLTLSVIYNRHVQNTFNIYSLYFLVERKKKYLLLIKVKSISLK